MEPQVPDQNQPATTTAAEPWHAPLNRVTTVSKILAAVVFITLPFVGFWLGMGWGEPGYSPTHEVLETVVVNHARTVVSDNDEPKEVQRLIEQLKSASIPYRFSVGEQYISLVEGSAAVYLQTESELAFAWRVRITDHDQYRIVGDVNGDGKDDVAAITESSGGGSGLFRGLTLFLQEDGELIYTDTVFLGDRIEIKELTFRDGEFVVDIITQGPGEPMCCGTTPATLTFKLKDNELVRVYPLDEQKGIEKSAEAEAKELSASSLESLLSSGLASLLKEYDLARGLMMGAYLREYVARGLSSPAVSSLHEDLNTKYGPCWGIPEGECRE